MKVLFINTVYGRGSTGRIVADLGKMLEENGHEFKVAYGRGNHKEDLHCYRIGNDLDMYIHAGLSRITDRTGFYSKSATRKLVEFIRVYDPDIIHLHNLHGYYLNIEILFQFLANEYKGRVIWTLHDCWAFTGHCVHFTYAECDMWKTGCSNCHQKNEYPASFLYDRSTKNYRDKRSLFTTVKNLEIVTVSNWLKKTVEESFLKNAKVTCIYNGIDTDRFRVPCFPFLAMMFIRVWQLLCYWIDAITTLWWTVLLVLIALELIWLLSVRRRTYFHRAVDWSVLLDWIFIIETATVLSRSAIESKTLEQLISFDISTAWAISPGVYGAIDTYTELAMNILMFMPFGYLLAKLSGGRKWIVFGGCFLITLSIETLQLFLRRGFFELADILLNMTGAVLGYAAYRVIRRLVAKWKKHSAQAE